MQNKKIIFLSALVILLSINLLGKLYNKNSHSQIQTVLGTNTALDTILKQTIDSINQYGWDPSVNGYHINWYRDNPNTYQNAGHDGQNELRMYQAMVGYKYLHPQDTSLDSAIQRVLPLFQSEWQKSTLDKGWIYFTFLRLREYTKDPNTWDTTMQNWAASVYKEIPSDTGVPHGPIVESTAANAPTCPDGYRVDQQIENGLALVDAGKRYNHSEWSQAGAKEVQIITNEAFNTKYKLFNRIMCQGKPWDVEARDGEMGQIAEALLYAGSYTNNQEYLSFAQQLLDTIANPATGLIDQQYGGLFFKITMDTGTVDTSKKVTQQYHILFAFHLANQIMNNRYASIEANMIQAIQKAYFQPPVAGWMYEVAPDFTLYKGTENWISTEASGIAMQAILGILEGNTPLLSTQNPSGTISPSITTTPTGDNSVTSFSVTVCPHGLGNCGDNANQNSGGNTSPKYQQQQVTVNISNANNNQLTQGKGTISYNPIDKNYQGIITVPNIQNGNYLISVKMNGFLSKQIPGIISLSPEQTIVLPKIPVVNGDINNDNQLDILDYNLLIGCFGQKLNTSSCTVKPSASSAGADISYDGNIDGIDYNLFLRELSVQKGN